MNREKEAEYGQSRQHGTKTGYGQNRQPGEGNPYDDIIDLPHHVSTRHPRMSPLDRAAQFSPFAALTGHDAAIRETARLAESRMETEEPSCRGFRDYS